jgi:hypothetical protein
MKSYRKYLEFHIKKRREFVNITPEVVKVLAESGVREGLVLVNAMHITASVFINDDESGLQQRRCPHEKADYGPGSGDCGYRRQAGFWALGADFLW